VHAGLLRVRRRKMSKSLKNFIPIREALSRYGVHALRLYFSLTHYRKPLDFRYPDLDKAFRLSHSFHNSVEKMKGVVASSSAEERDINLDGVVTRCESRFIEAMDDDFDTESAVKELMDLVRYSASGQRLKRQSPRSLSGALRSLTKLSNILGIL